MKNRFRQTFFASMLWMFAVGVCYPTDAQERSTVTLFENVRIFDGKSTSLSASSSVLVRGNIIERISTAPIAVDRSADTRIIDGGGRVLMPGHRRHWHAMLARRLPHNC